MMVLATPFTECKGRWTDQYRITDLRRHMVKDKQKVKRYFPESWGCNVILEKGVDRRKRGSDNY